MKHLLKLKKDRAKVAEEMRAILTKATAENRDINAEEQAAHEKLEKDFEAIKAKIVTEERMVEIEKEVAEDFTDEEEPTVEPAEDPELRSAGKKTQTAAAPEKKYFDSFGDQLLAVARSCTPSQGIDSRLLEMRKAELRTPSGLNESGNPSDGGFLVQKDFSAELLKNAWDYGQLISDVSTTPIGPNSNGMTFLGLEEYSRATGSRHGGVQIYWAAEAETKSPSKPKFSQTEMNLHKLLGFCYTTEEMLSDSTALSAIISESFRDEFSFVLDDVVLSGNGAGKPLGILNSDALVSVARESGQTDSSIRYINILKMYARMMPRSLARAKWYINQACIVTLAQMQLVGATSDTPVFIPAQAAGNPTPFNTLFGRPIIPIEQCSAPGALGDIIFGDLSQYRMITKDGLKASSSIHVRYLYDEEVFKFSYRCDGQPKMKKAITPFKGSDTISPFIALAQRQS